MNWSSPLVRSKLLSSRSKFHGRGTELPQRNPTTGNRIFYLIAVPTELLKTNYLCLLSICQSDFFQSCPPSRWRTDGKDKVNNIEDILELPTNSTVYRRWIVPVDSVSFILVGIERQFQFTRSFRGQG